MSLCRGASCLLAAPSVALTSFKLELQVGSLAGVQSTLVIKIQPVTRADSVSAHAAWRL
jgi:hypothetical protein